MSDKTQIQADEWQGARSEGAGSVIGPFTLLRLVGEGGFGDVWEAEQSEPVRRRVALKIVKLGMDTREVIARFAMERQTLAAMEHPHIAHVIDAGATATGRPYFAMEFVEGVPISDYCAAHKLSVDAILKLYMQVCAAVQHAHTKGIIHRDLKPSNVLVGTQDGQPFAKVIDFGIAKATAGEDRDRTLATRIHQVVGTPLYMSPEQALGSLDIDTRTDIYSLGVILYELLTGTTPVEREKLASVSIADTQKLICHSEPPKPSARVLSNATTLTGSATFRPADPHKLARTIRGDLDWIVMKALEKEPARRYQSAAEFADDLRRYLAGEAVSAVPPSLSYRTGKFVRRNKTVVAAGALIALSLIAGLVAFAWQARIARTQMHIAQQQMQVAESRTKDLQQVTAFEAEMFEQIDPAHAGDKLAADLRGKFTQSLRKQGLPDAAIAQRLLRFDADFKQINATDAARDVIDQNVLRPAAASIDGKFGKQPLIAAQLRQSLAKRYSDMGMYDAALPLQLAALEAFRRELGEDAPDTAIARFNVGGTLQYKGEWAKAESYYLAALASARKLNLQDSEVALAAMGNLGVMYADQGRFALAEPYYRQVLETRRRLFGNDSADTLLALQNMGSLLRTEGKYAQAEPYLREAAAAQERVSGPTADSTLYALGNIALLEQARGRYDLAEKQIAEVLARARRAYGETYPTTLLASIILGDILEDQGKHAQAERLLAGIDAPARQTFNGDNAYWRGMLLCHLGKARSAQANYAPAEANLLEGRQLLTIPHAPQEAGDLRECTQALVDLYTAWDKAEPGKGHAAKAQQWQTQLNALDTAAKAAVVR